MCGRYLIEDEAYADILQILHDLNAAQDRINMDNITNAGNVAAGVGGQGVVGQGEPGLGEFMLGEVFPTNIAPVIVSGGAVAVKWGFPHWKNSGVIINARSETALEKKMFGKPLRERRCAVPSSGFYEWGHIGNLSQGNTDLPGYVSLFGSNNLPDCVSNSRSSKSKKKDKFLLRQPEDNILYMAGMVSTFRDALGEPYDAFVILTTAANDSVSPIHDRMPVILAPDEASLWVKDSGFMEFVLHRPGPELSVMMVS